MANICSVDFNIDFKTDEEARRFAELFGREVADGNYRNEGVRIAENDWLFDATVENDGSSTVVIRGYVRWALSSETVAEFAERLTKAGAIAFDCQYEECGNLFGKYEYADGTLVETSLDESHSVWDAVAEGVEDSWELLERALRKDGVVEMVA